MRRLLREAVRRGALRDLDGHFALTLARICPELADEVLLAAALASRATGEGHLCMELPELAGRALFAEGGTALDAPPLDAWRAALRAAPVVGAPGDHAPLILDHRDRLYLARYWHFERAIVDRLRSLALPAPCDAARAREALDRLFAALGPASDQQRVAAAVALFRRFAVISGGPGTGKTTTVTRLLALLIEQSQPRNLRIALAAPTGKAAARLTDSIRGAKAKLDCEAAVREAIPEEATTLHRLLGVIPGESGFRRHRRNPLHLDLLVVDEASMVDVPLMARLLDALPGSARLILLGDKDQLSSVEAGSVLGDLCNRGERAGYSVALRRSLRSVGVEPGDEEEEGDDGRMLADSIVVLERSHRFDEGSGIGNLARAINRGDAGGAVAAFRGAADLRWREMDGGRLAGALGELATKAFSAYLDAKEPHEALRRFNDFRILCVVREGPAGVTRVNELVEEALRRRGVIEGRDRFYAGRPVMVRRNDYGLDLFNGDIGIVLPDPEADGRLRAFFGTPEGRLRRVLLNRLPDHETVFAMTVHKSQGSEFDRCLLLLPDDDLPLLTRELIYTGVTRARSAVEMWGSEPLFRKAVERRVERRSGLRDALWERSQLPGA